jgi:hypothetical protein
MYTELNVAIMSSIYGEVGNMATRHNAACNSAESPDASTSGIY